MGMGRSSKNATSIRSWPPLPHNSDNLSTVADPLGFFYRAYILEKYWKISYISSVHLARTRLTKCFGQQRAKEKK